MTEAHLAIPQLLYRYARAVDRLDMALLESVFAADAVIELGTIFSGDRTAFAAVVEQFMGPMTATRHELGNILIEVDGESAAVEAYVTAWHRLAAAGTDSELVVRARYLSRAERRDGRWQLVRHSEVMDWGSLVTTDSAWFDQNGELPKGSRDSYDLSFGYLGIRRAR